MDEIILGGILTGGLGLIIGFLVGQQYEKAYSKNCTALIRASYEWRIKELTDALNRDGRK